MTLLKRGSLEPYDSMAAYGRIFQSLLVNGSCIFDVSKLFKKLGPNQPKLMIGDKLRLECFLADFEGRANVAHFPLKLHSLHLDTFCRIL